MSRLKILLLRLGLGLAGGFLLGLPFLVLPLAPVAYFGMVPWVLLCTHPRLREKDLFVSMTAGSFVFYFMAIRLFFSFG